MSNLPPNPYNNVQGQHQNANPGPQYQYGQVPLSHPPGGLQQDANSNSPVPMGGYNTNLANHLNQSASNSPAFNQPPLQPTNIRPSPVHPPMKSTSANPNLFPVQSIPQSSASLQTVPNITSAPSPYPPNYQQRQINDNAPPLVASSQYNQLVNGPQSSIFPPASSVANQYPVSSGFNSTPLPNKPQATGPGLVNPNINQRPILPPSSIPAGPMTSQPNVPLNGPPPGLPRNSPLIPPNSGSLGPGPNLGPPLGPPRVVNGPGSSTPGPVGQQVSGQGNVPPISMAGMGPPMSGPTMGPPVSMPGMRPPVSMPGLGPQVSGPGMGPPVSGPAVGPPVPGPAMGPPVSGPPMGPPVSSPGMGPPISSSGIRPLVSGPGMGPLISSSGIRPLVSGPGMGPPVSGPGMGPPVSGPGMGPPVSGPGMGPPVSGPGMGPPKGPLAGPPTSQTYMNQTNGPPVSAPQMGPGSQYNSIPPQAQGMQNQPMMQQGPPAPQTLPPMGQPQPAPPSGKSNMQNRYPQMQQQNYANHQPPPPPGFGKQYPQQYSTQQLTQQMGQLSVTRQGFDQLWGHTMIDLLQCKHILPEYPEDPPEIKLAHFPEATNCSPEIFRCTINRIPDTSSLLQKSRLPLGLLIHPFKDLNHLPVIQCSSIVRCRACRTYINPFVYFVDAKRWKCNLCYRVNELPEEFQYDPVSQSYGDPTRRPEIKSATIEFIAPAEYMLRPPQPAIYLFLFDVSQIARDSGYLLVVCDTLKSCLDQLPGDARTQLGFICYDAHVHYYLMSDGLTRPKEMTVLDIDEIFLPSPESLLVNLGEYKEMIKELLTVLPQRYSTPGVPVSALGAALQAAYKLLAPTGGRITVFQTCLPNIGPGALQSREDPNARSSKEVAHLNPATDFYKRLALDCSGAQVAVDLFLLSSQYCDLATLSGMSKFSAGTVYHIPLFRAARAWQADQLTRMLTRYLTRKIGFEAVMRVRCTRGITIHTFHGNLFVRSTDLLSLANVSPDAGFGLQLAIDEPLSDLQQVCFQAALLYTSSKGERRIRVHTLALPIASNLTDVLHAADQQCIVGLLSKMAVDRSASASMSEAREALMNVAVDALSAHRLAQNLPAGSVSSSLHAPASLRLLPLYLLALLKRKAFRTGTSTRLDERVADMCAMKCLPLPQLMRLVYPDLYPIHTLRETAHIDKQGDEEEIVPDPPRMHLTAERINMNGAYLLDDGETMIIYVCHGVSPAFLSECFGVAAFSQLPDEARTLPRVDSPGNTLLHAFVDKLNDDRPYASNILVLRDNSPSRQMFVERLVDDRVESAFSYFEFLQHVKTQVK